jgi:hypothetical protein
MPTFSSASTLSLYLKAALSQGEDSKDSDTVAPLSLTLNLTPSKDCLSLLERLMQPNKGKATFKKLVASISTEEVSMARSIVGACLRIIKRFLYIYIFESYF